eukprot:TRINITY_DN5256_c0_g1_i1.p1 TRINITY_DN5256_c0_g1~~TRINITY_DN5256_c0_g1_i1.p1  ORF type:complete len:674 (+),score=165.09 TRINITY_DN5256_c0_g1_i1:136-2157(+)
MDRKAITHKVIEDLDEEADYPDEYARLGEAPVELEKGWSKVIVVDNLPIIPESKHDKLLSVIRKIYTQIGPVVDPIVMPKDDKGNTLGFAIIEFQTKQAAETAIKQTEGYKLDKQHIFRVNSYEDFEKYDKMGAEFKPIEMPPYQPKDNVMYWLLDEASRDQYVIRYDDVTEVFWNNRHDAKPESVYKRKEMTQTYLVWSPYGTYLGSFHKQGVILWGGPQWSKLKRFSHQGVILMDFSPKENYLVTLSNDFPNEDPKNPKSIMIWDVRSGVPKRPFAIAKDQPSQWPVFLWSHDEKYFARLTGGVITVYETPSMKAVGGKPLPYTNIKEFSWSPSDNYIACWTPESGNTPARILLIEMPSMKILRSHNIFQVTDCKLRWQNRGDYLCAAVDRHTKSKKNQFTNFELYRLREKNVPVDLIEIKEQIIAFAWEPTGNRFAVIHTTSTRHSVSFYSMKGVGEKCVMLNTLEKRQANHLFWSPQGRFIVLAGFGNFAGMLEFYDVQEQESMRTDQHTMVTALEWDPTGRYVSTGVSYWRHQLENGYTIWTFQGKEILHVSKEKFCLLAWRPRPPSVLPKQRLKEIANSLPQISKKFKADDERKEREMLEAKKNLRTEKRNKFNELRQTRQAEIEADREKLRKLLGKVWVEEEDQWEELEEDVEELQGEVTTEILDS